MQGFQQVLGRIWEDLEMRTRGRGQRAARGGGVCCSRSRHQSSAVFGLSGLPSPNATVAFPENAALATASRFQPQTLPPPAPRPPGWLALPCWNPLGWAPSFLPVPGSLRLSVTSGLSSLIFTPLSLRRDGLASSQSLLVTGRLVTMSVTGNRGIKALLPISHHPYHHSRFGVLACE